jgi:hypothetical protein
MEPESSLPHLKSPPPVPILSHINPVHVPISLLEDPFEYYLPSTTVSSKWSPSLRSPHQNLVCTSLLSDGRGTKKNLHVSNNRRYLGKDAGSRKRKTAKEIRDGCCTLIEEDCTKLW